MIVIERLLETLRERRDNTGDPVYGYAADEIERLRAGVPYAIQISGLLREAVDHLAILSEGEADDPSVGIVGWNDCHRVVAEARAALAKNPNPSGTSGEASNGPEASRPVGLGPCVSNSMNVGNPGGPLPGSALNEGKRGVDEYFAQFDPPGSALTVEMQDLIPVVRGYLAPSHPVRIAFEKAMPITNPDRPKP